LAKTTNEPAASEGVLHLPKGTSERRTLECAERLNVPFDVESSGLIILVAATGEWSGSDQLLPHPRPGQKAPHRLELVPPGNGAVAVERVSETAESTLVYEVPEGVRGRWTARLTNLGTTQQEFGLFVSYPGPTELRTSDLPASVFADLAALRLELQRGHQASSLTIETPAGPLTHYFTIDDIEYSCPWTPRVVAYFENLRSVSTNLSVPEDDGDPRIRFELGFGDEGVEINGTIPLDLRDIQLTIDLPIVVRYHKATESKTLSSLDYEEADVKAMFTFEPQFGGVVEWFPGFFSTWRRLIQRAVEKACRNLLADYQLRKVLSETMEARLLAQLGTDARPVGVTAADGKLRFSYYTLL
jgi:hypothetical protein